MSYTVHLAKTSDGWGAVVYLGASPSEIGDTVLRLGPWKNKPTKAQTLSRVQTAWKKHHSQDSYLYPRPTVKNMRVKTISTSRRARKNAGEPGRCIQCGKPVSKSFDPFQQFCSDECVDAEYAEAMGWSTEKLQREREKAALHPRHPADRGGCVHCGSPEGGYVVGGGEACADCYEEAVFAQYPEMNNNPKGVDLVAEYGFRHSGTEEYRVLAPDFKTALARARAYGAKLDKAELTGLYDIEEYAEEWGDDMARELPVLDYRVSAPKTLEKLRVTARQMKLYLDRGWDPMLAEELRKVEERIRLLERTAKTNRGRPLRSANKTGMFSKTGKQLERLAKGRSKNAVAAQREIARRRRKKGK